MIYHLVTLNSQPSCPEQVEGIAGPSPLPFSHLSSYNWISELKSDIQITEESKALKNQLIVNSGFDPFTFTPFTRDTLEERARIKDIHIVIIDSAGLRDNPGVIEEQGIQRTRTALEKSDLALVIFDASPTS